jgi:hypothetical protein
MNGRSHYFKAALLTLLCLVVTPILVLGRSDLSPVAAARGLSRSELKIERIAAEPNDLPSIKATDLKNGAVFRIFYDEPSLPVAEELILVLAAFYRELAELSLVDASRVKWASVVFSQNTDYVPARRENDVRWLVPTDKNGRLTPHGRVDFYLVIPHEQVHAIQKTFIPQHAMRWLKEGLATWLGLKVTEKWNPELARRERDVLAAEQQKVKEPLNLRQWGSVKVKGDAIMRQMTPEEREKLKQNPGSVTSGSFTFSKNDIISDESNAKALYAAALTLFEEVEKKAGPQKIDDWLKSIWEYKAELSTNAVIELTLAKTGVDIGSHLK